MGKELSIRESLYDYIYKKGLGSISHEELQSHLNKSSWPRMMRQLRQDGIIIYEFDRKTNCYEISQINKYVSSKVRTTISTKDAYRIRVRDGHRCQSCGKGVKDDIKLEIDHKIPVDWGGTNNDDNLWVLCNICNNAKKSFYKDDFDNEVMKKVFVQTSGYQRLRVLFEQSPNKQFPPSILQGISQIRDWTRTIRSIREKYKMNINWVPPNNEYPNGYYINEI